MKITNGIDPFKKCITIASLCHYVYRKTLMKPSTISIIPALGYNPEQITSVKAMQWLKYQSFAFNIQIAHAKNGGEKLSVNICWTVFVKKTRQSMNFMVVFGMVAQNVIKMKHGIRSSVN